MGVDTDETLSGALDRLALAVAALPPDDRDELRGPLLELRDRINRRRDETVRRHFRS